MIVNIEQVIAQARMLLRLMDTQENAEYLQTLIESAARYRLNATNTFTIQCETAAIECNKAELPQNWESLEFFKLNPVGCSGCCQGVDLIPGHNDPAPNNACACPSVYYYNKAAVVNDDDCGWYNNYFYIQGNHIYFPSNTTATEVKIYYRGYNTDSEGFMLIDEETMECLAFYAAWQYALIFEEAYTKEQRATWERLWWAGKAVIDGRRIIREFILQKPQISLIVNAQLIQRRKGGLGY